MARTPKWQFSVHRDFNIFVQWIQTVVTQQDVQRRVFGFSVPLSNYLILAGDEFADTQDQGLYGTFLSKKLKTNQGFFRAFAKRERKLAQDAKAFQKHLEKNATRYALLTNRQLLKEFEIFFSVYIPIFGTAFVRPDDFLEQRLRTLLSKKYSAIKLEELFSVLATYSRKDANKLAYPQEPVELLRLVVRINKARNIHKFPEMFQREIDQHLKKYQWLKNPNLTELVSVTQPELISRLCFLLQSNPAKQIHNLQNARKKQSQLFHVLIKKEHFSKEIIQAINDLQSFIFLRTYTTESADQLFYVARSTLLAEIAKRMSLTRDLVVTCSGDEILKFFQTGKKVPSASELSKRQKNFVVLWKNAKGKILFGKEAQVLLKKYAKFRSNTQKRSTLLKGQTAFPGKVQGKVRVLKHWKESGKLKKGEILVVSMTTPEYIQAMEKASAFITDEGGITCHAAIIAREMQKPCVIGMKFATKILKTGDRVEVDAEKGIVRKL